MYRIVTKLLTLLVNHKKVYYNSPINERIMTPLSNGPEEEDELIVPFFEYGVPDNETPSEPPNQFAYLLEKYPLTIDVVATMLDTDTAKIEEAINWGKMPAVQIGGVWRISQILLQRDIARIRDELGLPPLDD